MGPTGLLFIYQHIDVVPVDCVSQSHKDHKQVELAWQGKQPMSALFYVHGWGRSQMYWHTAFLEVEQKPWEHPNPYVWGCHTKPTITGMAETWHKLPTPSDPQSSLQSLLWLCAACNLRDLSKHQMHIPFLSCPPHLNWADRVYVRTGPMCQIHIHSQCVWESLLYSECEKCGRVDSGKCNLPVRFQVPVSKAMSDCQCKSGSIMVCDPTPYMAH